MPFHCLSLTVRFLFTAFRSPQLEDFRFATTRVQFEGGQVLAKALGAARMMTSLNLSDNTFGFDGAKVLQRRSRHCHRAPPPCHSPQPTNAMLRARFYRGTQGASSAILRPPFPARACPRSTKRLARQGARGFDPKHAADEEPDPEGPRLDRRGRGCGLRIGECTGPTVHNSLSFSAFR